VCILGGTGFVGRHLCSELSRRKIPMRVLTRRRERRRDLIVIPNLELVEADVHSVADLSVQMKGCGAVVNLIGILNEHRGAGRDFASVHGELPVKVAEACRYNRIGRLLHMSALGASTDAPRVMFGPEDDFFNRFASLLAMSPLVFPLACPDARMSPVYVEDVARVFADSLERKSTFGRRYDLCGPKTYTLRELVEYAANVTGINSRIVPLGDALSRLQARVLEWVPGKPFSRDNYLSLQAEGVCKEDGFAAFGIRPTSLECIVPTYIGDANRMEFYDDLRRTARR
jgi:NADH dehydrogenase